MSQKISFSTSMQFLLPTIISVATLSVSPLIVAQENPVNAVNKANNPLQITLKQFKVVKNNKNELSLEDAKKVKPGEVIEYQATYKNVGSGQLKGIVATIPVPKEMEYQAPNKLTSRPLLASVDGKKFAPYPLSRIIQKDNLAITVEVPLKEYRGLQWHIQKLDANEAMVIKMQAKVLSN
jgi:uncharacterized repeat protein (TIGR01451 family)